MRIRSQTAFQVVAARECKAAQSIFADHEDLERMRDHGRSRAACVCGRTGRGSTRCGSGCRSGCRRYALGLRRCGGRGTKLGGDEKDVAGLRVQREGFGSRWCGHGLFHAEACGRVFLDDRQRAVALRTEGLHGRGIEGRAVTPVADGEIGDDVAIGRGENDHVLVVATARRRGCCSLHRARGLRSRLLCSRGRICPPSSGHWRR